MNPALFFSLWSLAFGSLLGGQFFVHQHYLQVMHQDARHFEQEWKKLEKTYGHL